MALGTRAHFFIPCTVDLATRFALIQIKRQYDEGQSLSEPSLIFLRINSTGMRVQRMTGLPNMIAGLISIRGWTVM